MVMRKVLLALCMVSFALKAAAEQSVFSLTNQGDPIPAPVPEVTSTLGLILVGMAVLGVVSISLNRKTLRA